MPPSGGLTVGAGSRTLSGLRIPSTLRRRLCAGLLFAALAAAAGLHHHEDLAGTLRDPSGASPDRVVSNHSPLSKASHWHAGVSVKDDPCEACKSNRMAGVLAGACLRVPLAAVHFATGPIGIAPVSLAVLSNGSRAPPALL